VEDLGDRGRDERVRAARWKDALNAVARSVWERGVIFLVAMSGAAKVIHWNGRDVPEALPELLRDLPPGQYSLERVLTPSEAGLTTQQEDGIRAALRSLERGEGIAWETVRDGLLAQIDRRERNDPR
jgi:hypothetical protein